jgi:predicted hotdog family 3-hydroxylacyl-ACP dehydratase
VSDGEVDPLVAVEWMSQAAACLAALNAHAAGASACARLLESVPEANFGSSAFRSDEPLFIDARLVPDGSFACGVMRGDQRLASAVLRLRERTPDDAETAA